MKCRKEECRSVSVHWTLSKVEIRHDVIPVDCVLQASIINYKMCGILVKYTHVYSLSHKTQSAGSDITSNLNVGQTFVT